ncbi:DUF2158 domain-containing protein [Pseudoduganella sp. LjRoot289]|uniref:DUF2158 domain-containing protein n=1 Tax=Pseudoduganella sp. LjRoot289 TaxID=3342314 RepID=UPI003ECD5800
MRFQTGDVVRLKTGGADMEVLCTAQRYPFPEGEAEAVLCIWEDTHFRFEKAFPVASLDIVSRASAWPLHGPERYARPAGPAT